jgi:hypothetical protein
MGITLFLVKVFKEGFEQFVAFVHLFFCEVKRSSGSALLNLLFLAYSIQNQLLLDINIPLRSPKDVFL